MTNHAIRRSKKIVLALLLPVIITHMVILPIPISPIYFFGVPLSILKLAHIDRVGENSKIFVLSVIVFYLINSTACLIFLKRIVRWIVRLTRKIMNRISASLKKIESSLIDDYSSKKRVVRTWKRVVRTWKRIVRIWKRIEFKLIFKIRRALLWCMK